MTKAEVLRYWLVNNGFYISEEDIIKENGMLFQIIKVKFGTGRKLNDAELFVGQRELMQSCAHYGELKDLYRHRFESIVSGMEASAAASEKLAFYRNILCELADLEQKNEQCL